MSKHKYYTLQCDHCGASGEGDPRLPAQARGVRVQ